MRMGLINIGDELLAGKTVNTNAFDLAHWLAELGHELGFTLAVADRSDAIAAALRFAAEPGHCEFLLLTGGLGPTQDDRTREAVASFLGRPLEFSTEAEVWLAERLGVAPEVISEGQKSQLYLPQGALALHNPSGTACGFGFDLGTIKAFALPGVPSEFRALFELHCRPILERRDAVFLRRRVFTFALAESRQWELLQGFTVPDPFRFSSLPSDTSTVAIALEGLVPEAEAASYQARLDAAWADLLSRLPAESIVDPSGADLPEAVFQALRARGATVAVAESCTAGALGFLITETPGSSEVFKQGYLTYSNEAKTALLGVEVEVLKRHGAVSEYTALAMAQGCLKASGADFAVAITGIAGPDGGSKEKPVGLVYIAVASKKRSEAFRFQFRGNRKKIRWRSAYTAMNRLRLFIYKEL